MLEYKIIHTSIFIASITIIVCPLVTLSPTLNNTFYIVPGIGLMIELAILILLSFFYGTTSFKQSNLKVSPLQLKI